MRTHKFLILLLIVFLIFGAGLTSVVAQDEDGEETGEPDAEQIGVDSAQQKLRTVSVSKFEDAGFWGVSMPREQGTVSLRALPGSPMDKEPIEGEEETGIEEPDNNVLGVKVNFYKRGYNFVSIKPARPLPVEGITKTVSMWIVGRNSPHTLKMLISDQFGNSREITMGELNFSGWKELTAAIPSNIRQRDPHYQSKQGIRIEGFRIDFHPEDTYGTYYVYFDGLRATTDLFAEESRDADDMPDNW